MVYGCVQAVFARITFRSADFPSSCTARTSLSLRHCHLPKFCLKFLILLQFILFFPQISSVLLKRNYLKNWYETIIGYNFVSTTRGRWRKWRFPGNFKLIRVLFKIFLFLFSIPIVLFSFVWEIGNTKEVRLCCSNVLWRGIR